jgi:hypothetical protein
MKFLFTFISILLIFILVSPLYATITFERWYGGSGIDHGYSVCEASNGDYIVVGSTKSYGVYSSAVMMIQTDSIGDTIRLKLYDATLGEYGASVSQTYDGGYIISGWTFSFARYWSKGYLIKVDSLGDTLWTRHYGKHYRNAQFFSAIQTLDSGYVAAGFITDSTGSNSCNIYLVKIDSNGDTLWTKKYGGYLWDEGYSVDQTLDGGYIITGSATSFGAGGQDVYLIKTNSDGDTLWTKTYGGSGSDKGNSVSQTLDGGYIIAGTTNSFGAGNADIYLVKTNSTGDSIWTKTYGGTEYDNGYCVSQTSDGGYILTGKTNSYGAGFDDVYIIKTDSLGDIMWTRTYGDTSSDRGLSIVQTNDGGFIVAGWTMSYGAGSNDFYLIKTDSLGNVGVKEHSDLRPEIRDIRLTTSPNPFTTSATISIPGLSEDQINRVSKIELKIYDISGKLVMSVPLKTKHLSLGTDLSPGIYFLKLKGKPVGKVVKVK